MTATPTTDELRVEQLASEVDAARDNLGMLVMRLDRKRHAVASKVSLASVCLALMTVGGGFIHAIARWRTWRKRTRVSAPLKLAAAFQRLGARVSG